MVEPQIVILDVAGSSPVGHPTSSFSINPARSIIDSKGLTGVSFLVRSAA